MNPLDTNVIDVELVKASLTDQAIAGMRDQFLAIKVKDIYDKPGYDAAKAAKKDAVAFRKSVEAVLKEVRRPAMDFQKAVVAREKEILTRVKEVEAHLDAQIAVYDAGKAEVEVPKTPEQQDADAIRALRDAIVAIPMPVPQTAEGARIIGAIREKLNEALLVK